jgi:hypothetical protein
LHYRARGADQMRAPLMASGAKKGPGERRLERVHRALKDLTLSGPKRGRM